MPLQESLVAYKRGAELLRYCQSTLKDAAAAGADASKRACSRRSRRRMPIGPQAMNPDLDWAVWCGERQRRIEDVLTRALAAPRTGFRSRSAVRCAMRCLDGGKRMRPLLAYAAGELVGGRSRHRRFRRCRGRARSTPIRSSTTIFRAWTTTRCAAASRRATSRSARRWRSWPAMRCRRSRSACSPRRRLGDPAKACALLAEASGVRGMAGGQAVDLGSVGRYPLARRTRKHAPDENRVR